MMKKSRHPGNIRRFFRVFPPAPAPAGRFSARSAKSFTKKIANLAISLLIFLFGSCIISLLPKKRRADVAQSVERILGKDEVAGSNPAISSRPRKP